MTTYSAFFSSGLLAPCIARPTTPTHRSSEGPIPCSPADPVDRELSITPTPTSAATSYTKNISAVSAAGERPRMRRRRSSINIAASPMAAIKSPSRNASSALQRSGIMSPTRSRAGSVNEASENTSLFGRLRSGSLNMMPPVRVRRAVRRAIPAVPPPTIPLPAVPPSPIKCASELSAPEIHVSMPRQPLSTRVSLTDNVGNLFSPTLVSPTLLSPTLLGPDYTSGTSTRVLVSRASSPAIPEHPGYFGNVGDVEMDN
ncbi:hypothetical protein ID866_8499 [Astraeus odoratus]|nr:hypothetical protein ID866_8499 [Astraeus odoratus]